MVFFDETLVLAMLLASAAYWLAVPERHRVAFITALSVATLMWIQPTATVCLGALVVAIFHASKKLNDPEQRGRVLARSVAIVGLTLVGAKYAATLISSLVYLSSDVVVSLVVPLGVSYLCFKLLGFAIDVYRGTIEDPKLSDLLALIFFLPTFPAGPIQRFGDFQSKHQGPFSGALYVRGLQRITLGDFKKIVLINALLSEAIMKGLYPHIVADGVSFDLPATTVLAFLLGSLLYAYLDLSSYADLAIGYGRLFGYEIVEDMRYPLTQPNLSDYWARWHISLSSWCRDYVYFPVLASTRMNNLALYASFFVMGIWHNASINWVLWGLWHATGIAVYSAWKRFRKKRKLEPVLPKVVGHALGATLTVLYASFSFSFIMFDGSGSMVDNATKALRLLAATFL